MREEEWENFVDGFRERAVAVWGAVHAPLFSGLSGALVVVSVPVVNHFAHYVGRNIGRFGVPPSTVEALPYVLPVAASVVTCVAVNMAHNKICRAFGVLPAPAIAFDAGWKDTLKHKASAILGVNKAFWWGVLLSGALLADAAGAAEVPRRPVAGAALSAAPVMPRTFHA